MTAWAEPRSPPEHGDAPESADRPAAYSPLVLTKLRVPKLRQRIVDRARLVASLDETDAGLILVSAPAGYGKTTLLAAWAQACARAGACVAWYSLDATDNDPMPFGAYLVASLSHALGRSDGLTEIAQVLRSSPEVDLQKVMSAVINALAVTECECLLTLDDYHLIASREIHQAIGFLLERHPDNLRIAIGTRSDPPLPIAKLRAQGKIAELRAADLRFTRDETADFLRNVMDLAVESDVVAALESRTEGWIVGLQLAALSLAGRPVDPDSISTSQGNSRFLIQYLLDEVVSRQADDVQDFLLATSVLERICAPLCDALLTDSDSARLLDQLERANLFVVALDDRAVWYRYHHLFREFLRARLEKAQPERTALLHRRASEWHESQGNLREAVRHAIETHDWEYAAELVERHGMATLMHSEYATVYEWCKVFPEATRRTHPFLCVLEAWTLVLAYRRDHRARVEQILQMAEEGAAALHDAERGRWLAGQAAVVRTFLGNVPDPHVDPRAELVVAQRALDLLDPGEPLRSTTMLMVSYSHLALDQVEQAYSALEETRTLALAGKNYYGATDAHFQQARLAHEQGQLRRAADLCLEGRADIAAVLGNTEQELPAVGSLDIALGCVRLEQDRLTEAEQLLLHGLDVVGFHTGIPYYRFVASVALARVREIQGRYAESSAFLTPLQDLWPDIAFCVQALQMLQAIRSDSHDPATVARVVAWSHQFSQSLAGDIPLPGLGPLGASEPYYIALLAWARARIIAGEPTEALAYLVPQLDLADRHGLKSRVMEVSVAEALARFALGDRGRAIDSLARALEIGESEGYVRSFDEGRTLTELLMDAAHRGIARSYVEHILQAIGSHSGHDASASRRAVDGLVESLTEREAEVLRLLDSGLPNREIADQLVISVGTVKRHTANIYAKLGVESRTQAIVRARSLGLL